MSSTNPYPKMSRTATFWYPLIVKGVKSRKKLREECSMLDKKGKGSEFINYKGGLCDG
jgi:hypothetical protein